MTILLPPPTRIVVVVTLTLTLRVGQGSGWPFLFGPLSTGTDGRPLERLADDLEDRLEQLTARLEAQAAHITDLGTHLTRVTHSVSFTVSFSGGDIGDIGEEQTLMFDKVLFNAGGGYSSRSGLFTAPSAGLYAFNIQVSRHRSSPDRCVEVDLVHSFTQQSHSVLPEQRQSHSEQHQSPSVLSEQQQSHSVLSEQQQSHSVLSEQQQSHSVLSEQQQSHSSLSKQQQSHTVLSGQQQSHSLSVQQQSHTVLPGQRQRRQSSSSLDYTQQAITKASLCPDGNNISSSRVVVRLAQGDTVHARIGSGTMSLGDVFISMSGLKLAVLSPLLSPLVR
ncbi:uncharacterized protein LOC143298758 isoform X2 [Babylonia areolata]